MFVMANTGCSFGTPRKRKHQMSSCLHEPGPWPCLWGILLTARCCRRAQPTGSIPMPEKMGLGSVRKELSKPAISVSSDFFSDLFVFPFYISQGALA